MQALNTSHSKTRIAIGGSKNGPRLLGQEVICLKSEVSGSRERRLKPSPQCLLQLPRRLSHSNPQETLVLIVWVIPKLKILI